MTFVSAMRSTVTTKHLHLLWYQYHHLFMWRFLGFWNFWYVVNILCMIRWTSQSQRQSPSPLASHRFSRKHSYSSQLVMNRWLASTKPQEVLPPLCDVPVSPSQLSTSEYIIKFIVFENTTRKFQPQVQKTWWMWHQQIILNSVNGNITTYRTWKLDA